MSIGMSLLAALMLIASVPPFVAAVLLIYLLDAVEASLIENFGIPTEPLAVIFDVLAVGIFIGAAVVAFFLLSRLRDLLKARWVKGQPVDDTSAPDS